jgi:hypothetical protein
MERSAYPGTDLCRQYWKRRRERARATTYFHSVAEAEIPTLSNGAREKIEKKYHWQAAHLTDSGRARSGRNYYLE